MKCQRSAAQYHDDSRVLIIRLGSFLRPIDLRGPERHLPAPWLPKPDTLYEPVDFAEAVDLARDIFQRWARRVREAAPLLHSHASQP